MPSSSIFSMGERFPRRDSAETDQSQLSSGLTTPADEESLHHFDPFMLPPDAQGGKNISSLHGLGASKQSEIAPQKTRSLSRAVAKAKQFAQSIGKSNKTKKMDAPPLMLPSPASIRAYDVVHNIPVEPSHLDPQLSDGQRRQTLFNLPNEDIESRITAENPASHQVVSLPVSNMERLSSMMRSGIVQPGHLNEETIFLESSTVSDAPVVSRTDLDDLHAPLAQLPALSLSNIFLLLRLFCFLPWCIAVGGAIILCPSRLDLITFRAGYQSPLEGVQRFAYWADCAMQHVAIFCGCIAAVGWWNKELGALLTAGVGAGFFFAWGNFVLDRRVPLGKDDRQTIYLVLMNYGLNGDDMAEFRKTDDGYLVLECDEGCR